MVGMTTQFREESSNRVPGNKPRAAKPESSRRAPLGSVAPERSNIAPQRLIKPKSMHVVGAGVAGYLIARTLMGTNLLAIPFSGLGAALPGIFLKRKLQRRQELLAGLWPELLDHMISGLRSGLSIAETISGLAARGPEISRPIFAECKRLLISGTDMSKIFIYIKGEFSDPVADQVCEVLDFARGTGSRDTAVTLRTLGDFIRSDIAVRGEIQAKLGWIKNSAVVAAAAPWILLVILSTQPTTLQAFSTLSGHLILLFGVLLSALAYIWMSRVGRVQEVPRIFRGDLL